MVTSKCQTYFPVQVLVQYNVRREISVVAMIMNTCASSVVVSSEAARGCRCYCVSHQLPPCCLCPEISAGVAVSVLIVVAESLIIFELVHVCLYRSSVVALCTL